MNDQRSLTTWARLVLAAVLATALGVTIGASTQTGIAQAVDVAPPTLFQIDGDRLGPNDFAAPYGPGLTPAPGSYPTTGLYSNVQTVDQNGVSGCNLAADDTALGGTKLGDGPVWPIGGPNPNGKTDLDFIDLAAEKVDVNGQISDILYVGYQKCGGTGTWQTALYLDDGDGVTPTAGDANGDYLFVFDFNPSSGAVTFYQYNRTAGAWVLQPINNTFIKGLASGNYGEVALNLTGLNILDPNGARCSSITVSGPAAAITGGDLSSQVKDLLTFAPLPITNCGKVLVTKDSSPDGIVSTDTFHYALDQIDGKQSHAVAAPLAYASLSVETRPVGAAPSITNEPDADYAEIDADIQIDEQHTWTNVISQPDYFLRETVVAPNWARQSIQCTAANIFAAPVGGVYPLVTVTLPIAKPANYVVGAPDHFLVAPSNLGTIQLPPTTCTITNSTSGIIIAKNGAGSPTTFDFTVTGKPNQSVALGAQSTVIPFSPGSSVTITELAKTATPGWGLDSVDCDDPGNAQRSGNGITVTTVAGSVITCTFTNNQRGQIIVQKTGAPSGGAFPFEQSWDGNTNAPSDFTLTIPSSTNSGDLLPGTYTITELLSGYNATTDPDFVGSASCTGEDPVTATSGDVTATVNLSAGETVTCTFSNTQNGRIIVQKNTVNGDDTFSFTGDVSGSITTVGGSTPAGQALSADKAPGTYSVAETPKPGYTLTGSTCSDQSAPASIGVAAGEIVTCTFTNTRNAGSFTLKKVWGQGAIAGDTVGLSATVTGPAPIAGSINTSSTSPAATTSSTITVYSGQTVNFSELFSGAVGNGYTTSLSCDGGTLTPGAGNRSGSLAVGNTPGNVTCTFVNTPKVAGVALQKNWAANAKPGDAAALSLSTSPSGQSDSAISTAPAAPVFGGPADATDNTAFVGVVAGDTVTFTENLGGASPNYTTSFACTGATNSPVKINDHQYTLLIATADVAGAANINCAFTNTRIAVSLVLAKDWDDAIVGNAVTLAATGSTTSPISFGSTAGAADETDTSGTFTVFAGETLTLSETFTNGSAAAYDTSLSCIGATDANPGNGLTIAPADTSITCTYTNARRSVNVVVAKSLSPAGDNGAFDLSINGNVAFDGAVNGDASAPVSVFVGDQVTLGEAADAGSPALANYDSSLACNQGVSVAGNTGTAGSFVVPTSLASGTTITCTFTNVRKQAPLTVVKSWGTSPADDDEVDLTISGGLATPTAGNDTNDGDDTNDTAATATVYAGESISIAEVLDAAHPAAWYTTTLVCTDASGTLVDTTGSLTGAIAVPSSPTAIACTFTNQRKSATLQLRKDWTNARIGDTADLSIAGIDPASPGTATSTATQRNLLDLANVASLTVWVGETVDLTESLGAVDNLYNTNLTCEGQKISATTSGQRTITVADADRSIACTFHNVRRQLDLELVKDWATSPANGDAVDLSLTGGAAAVTSGVDSNDANDLNDSAATTVAYFGETITLGEAFTTGDAVNYITSLDCGDYVISYTAGSLSGSLAIDPTVAAISAAENEKITCTFTNVRKSTTLTLAKAWEKPVSGDTTTLSIDGEADGDSTLVTAPATTPVASATVYAGETVTIGEAFGVNNVASYDVSGLTCTDGSLTWTPGATSATLGVAAADTAAPISCTITNTAERGTIIVVKSTQGGDGTFSFDGTWTGGVDFDVTTAAGTGSVTFNDVLIGSYSVSELDPTPAFDGTNVTCTDGDGGSGPTASSAKPLTGTIDLDDDEVVTCTFTNTKRATIVVVKDAQPDAATDFAFTGALGAFTLDDDSDATRSNTFTSELLPAQGQSYPIAETATPGWTLDLQRSTCSNGNTFSGSGVTVTPAPGSTVTCTFVNTANPAGISATKSVEGVVGAWGPFTFSLSGGTFTGPADQAVSDLDPTADWTNLVQGQTYTLVESAEPGYAPGAAFTCVVILPGSEGPVALPDGDTAAAGFQFTAVAGAVYDCDITNVAIPPTLVVTKTTVGGTGSFTFDVTPTDPTYPVGALTADTTSVNPADTQTVNLQAGVGYTVAEQLGDAWVEGALTCTVTPADASGTVAYAANTVTKPGDAVACSITNTKRAKITVVKQTVPDGAAGSFGFDASWLGAAPGADFSLADGTSQTSAFLDPDTEYTVSELAAAGFRLTGIVCDSESGLGDVAGSTATITPTPGEIVSCTFTNTQRGPVTIAKVAAGGIERTGTTYTVSYTLTVANQSYIDEPFTLSDTPAMAANVTIQSMVVNGPGVTDKDLGPTGGEIISSTVPARAGQQGGPTALVYTVIVTFTMTPSNTAQDCVTGQAGNGAFNSATVTFEEPPTTSTSTACVDLPKPSITVTKAATSVAPNTATADNLFDYVATYHVAVTNSGDAPGSYTIADIPDFGLGATEGTPVFAPVPGNPQLIGPATTQNYTVTVPFEIAGSMSLDERTCSSEPYVAGEGGYNAVTVSYGPQPDPTDDACIDLPAPEITVTKVRTADTAVAVAGLPNTYEATFTITVTNNGAGPGSYTLTDTPVLPAGATVVSTTITPTPVAATAIEAGGVDVYTAVVRFTVAGDLSLVKRDCIAGRSESGEGAYNGVSVAWNGPTVAADDCVDIPGPNVTFSKTTAPAANRNADGTWTVVYTLTVANLGAADEAGPGQYTLTDTIDFGSNVAVNTITVDPAAPGFTGKTPNTVIATDVPIGHNETDVYTVTANVSINTVGANGGCRNEGGLYNRGNVQLATQEAPLTDDACASYSTLTLVKRVINDNGGNATTADFPLSADGALVSITGVSPVAAAVPAGDYDLSEVTRAGYTASGFDCGDVVQEGNSVIVPLGANITCTIVNDDNPVDLRITKTDGGVTAIAGGAPFTYTISVSNIGTRNVDLGEPVTVTDQLPAGLVWVSFPANCSQSGQTLTCSIAPALLPAGGQPVVITATVRALADTPSGVVTNLVSVTTQDDPAPEQPSCSSESNNVDCEPTPIDRQGAIQIVKTDSVADGASVQPNDTFSYSLVVTNVGVSTILPGAVVTDDLPAQLSLVSVVGGSGWSCNNVDPIECTYAPSLLPGAMAPAITVNVQVRSSATGTSIPNTAVVVGAVDRDCLTPTEGLAEAFVPACNQVTDSDDETTPLVAQADMAIVKTASVTTIGAGGGFDWILDVTNNGPSTALNVVVGDIVPSSLTVTKATSSQFSCSVSGNSVSCTKASMAVGEKGQITITVGVPASAASGTITNVGTVQSSTPDPNLTNNSDDASVTVVAQQVPTTTLPPVILPPTGSSSTSPVVTAAILLILLGGGVVLVSRRRRDGQPAAS